MTAAAPEQATETSNSSEAPPVEGAETNTDLSGVTPGEEATPDSQEASTESQKGEADSEASAPAYDSFTLPDGYSIADEDLSAFTSVLNEIKTDESGHIGQEGAQQLVDLFVSIDEARSQQSEAQAAEESAQMRAEWQTELRDHPELGGDNLQGTIANVDMLEKIMPEETREFLAETGLTAHPKLIPFLNQLGKMLQEDPTTLGGVSGQAGGNTPAQNMFANSGHV